MEAISLITSSFPLRGEIWDINLNPTIGAEISKIRPAVVISSDSIRNLPIRLIAPITGWNESFSGKFTHVKISPSIENGLSKISAIDTLQLRGVSIERFVKRRGLFSESEMDAILYGIISVIEYQ